jgi:hypothetical protein
MRHVSSSPAALAAAAALSGCAGRAPRATSPATGQVDEAARSHQESPAEESLGRPAGISIIQFGSLRTFWLLNCPTDATSPLRGRCALTRPDEADPSQRPSR